jgi:DNA-binding response OmpR family regulator
VQTLLIADDDREIVRTLQSEFQQRGYAVLTAFDGHMAFQTAKKFKPNLILMDVAMPMASGLKALELLRGTPETMGIPIIFMSSLPTADFYPALENAPRVAYLKKPVDMDDLLSLMQQFLKK